MPFNAQFNASDHDQASWRSGQHDAQMLAFLCITFQGIFGVGPGTGLRFGFINFTGFQYFPDLRFSNMSAIHPATGMMGVNEVAFMPVKGFRACRRLLALREESNEKEKGQFE